jgi:hypothetical protein
VGFYIYEKSFGKILTMKYIISESQALMLQERVRDYIETNFTPVNGWDTVVSDLEESGNDEYSLKGEVFTWKGEVFISMPREESYTERGQNIENYYNYYTCQYREERKIRIDKCPYILIPKYDYDNLRRMAPGLWEGVFAQWFTKNTGLPVKEVKTFDYEWLMTN